MKITYYFEPWVELGRPYLRYHNYRYQMGPQIRELVKQGFEIRVIMGEATYKKCVDENFNIPNVEISVIQENELRDIFPNYIEASNSLARSSCSNEQMEKMSSLLLDKHNGEEPDVFISFLSPVPFIKDSWKNTLVLYTEFGLFSRTPFPRSFYFDPFGMFNESYIRKYEKELRQLKMSATDKSGLKKFRKQILQDTIVEYSPIGQGSIKTSFDYNVLLPLQFSNYFGFDAYSNYKSQYDLLIDVLENIDSNIGVIVTEHTGWDQVITEHNKDFLQKKYPNLILLEDILEIPTASQFIMNYVDAVVSVSSSIGLQSMLWDKPLIAMGDSHLNAISYGDLKNIRKTIETYPKGYNDAVLSHLIKHYYFIEDIAYSGKNFGDFLKGAHEKYINGNINFDFYKDLKASVTMKNILKECRVESFISVMNDNISKLKNAQIKKNDISDPFMSKYYEIFSEYEAISFDIFDTLVQRPLMMPHQMFLFMQDDARKITGDSTLNFHHLRRFCENRVREESDSEEISVEDIYNRMSSEENWTDDITQQLINLEIQYELRFSESRSAGKKLFELAKLLNKKIILASDFHIHEDDIKKILNNCGYIGWNNLYVSTDHGKSKKYGGLFQLITKELDISPNDILHIGDNFESDIKNANNIGINALHLPKGTDLFFNNQTCDFTWSRERTRTLYPTESLSKLSAATLGLFINKMYESPEGTDKNSAFNGDNESFGYCVFGPVFLGFIQHLIEKSKEEGIEKLLFLSRDGAIMKKVYDVVSKHIEDAPKSEYVLTSRRALLLPSIYDEKDILEALKTASSPTTLAKFLENKFGVERKYITDEILEEAGLEYADQEISPNNQISELRKVLRSLTPVILKIAEEERKAAIKYYEPFFKGNVAVVDVGYSGTLQKQISKILNKKDITGFYLMTHLKGLEEAKKLNLNMHSYLATFGDHTSTNNPFKDRISFIESICSSDESSLRRIKLVDGNIEFDTKDIGKFSRRIQVIREIQNGIIKYSNDFLMKYRKEFFDLSMNPDFVTNWMFDILRRPSYGDAKIFNNIEHEDCYSGHEERFILADVIDKLREKDGRLTAEESRHLIDISDWKEGARALLPPKKGTQKAVPDRIDENEITLNISRYNNTKHQKNYTVHVVGNKINQFSSEPNNKFKRKLAKLRREPKKFFTDSKIYKKANKILK